MKTTQFQLMRYDAEDGKVFDWKDLEAHKEEDEKGNLVIQHLLKKTLFIGPFDNIENYVEVDEVKE